MTNPSVSDGSGEEGPQGCHGPGIRPGGSSHIPPHLPQPHDRTPDFFEAQTEAVEKKQAAADALPPGPEKAEAQEAAQLGAEVVKAKSQWSLSKKNIAQAASEKQAALRKKKKAEAMPEGPEKHQTLTLIGWPRLCRRDPKKTPPRPSQRNKSLRLGPNQRTQAPHTMV